MLHWLHLLLDRKHLNPVIISNVTRIQKGKNRQKFKKSVQFCEEKVSKPIKSQSIHQKNINSTCGAF